MTKNWKDVRPEIKRLYLTQKKSLEEVRKLMKDKHGFNASLRAYKNKLDEWGWKKYKKPSGLGTLFTMQNSSQDEISVPSTVVASDRTRLRELEEMLEHQTTLVGKDKNLLLSVRQLASRDGSDEASAERKARCDENIARVERNMKSLESILASLATQINPPTGFASCWKQQPMMLEDAHGMFIPIPLDVVDSWQIFDNVLQSHFRVLPGVKKVAKREYAIEDSATCTLFSRDCPWSSLCKAGLKVDMSMIFNDRSKTSVVCPKCDTISNERKGVMIECKNPSCEMFFRTEEEEDQPITASQVGHRQPRSSISISSSPLLSSVSYQDEEEDKPGLFKRVIMRIAKNISMINDQNKRRRFYEDLWNNFPQQLETCGQLDFSSPSYWESTDQTSPHPFFPPESHTQISGTVTLPSGGNQQVREMSYLTEEHVDGEVERMSGISWIEWDEAISGMFQYVPEEVVFTDDPQDQVTLSANLTNQVQFLTNPILPLPNSQSNSISINLTNPSLNQVYHKELDDYGNIDIPMMDKIVLHFHGVNANVFDYSE